MSPEATSIDSTNREALRILIARRRPTFICCSSIDGVVAEAGAGRPVADGVGRVLLEDLRRHDHVALGLRHLLAVGVEHEPADRGVRPRQRVVLEVGAQHRVEEPGADDVVGLRPQVHREHPREQVGVVFPPSGDLWRERRRRPRVHDVGVARRNRRARLAARPCSPAARPPAGRRGARLPRRGSGSS